MLKKTSTTEKLLNFYINRNFHIVGQNNRYFSLKTNLDLPKSSNFN